MRRAFVVTYGTRAAIVAASSPDEARATVERECRTATLHHGARGPHGAELAVREAEGRDWGLLPYLGGSRQARAEVAELLAHQLDL